MTGPAPDHGTRACYERGCRQPKCLAAHHDYLTYRRRQIVYGRWDPFTDAEPARLHLKELEAAGVTWAQSAAVAGVSPARVQAMMQGKTRRIRHSSAEKLLAVTVQAAVERDTRLTGSTGTLRRLQALMACGWTKAALAAELGIASSNLSEILGRNRVQEKTRRAVCEAYDRLWNVTPPAPTKRARTESERARRLAAANGWPPPLAWDDDVIDLPDGTPAEGWQRPKRLSKQDVADEAAELFRQGLDRNLAARRLGMKRSTLDTALARASRVAS